MSINYFKYFNLEERLDLDVGELRRKFYKNSRKYHPDFFTLKNKDQQDEVLSQSTVNNEAYRTLKDEDKRLKHLLEIRGVISEGVKEQLPPEFLMEMMDVNEAIMDAQLGELSKERYKEMSQDIDVLCHKIENDIRLYGSKSTMTDDDILRLKNSYYKKKYVNRLKENIKKIKQSCQ